jgi:flagellar hook protein FlgE
MIGALWTGISGLSSQQKALDNESNNIANVNTIGYKASRISFADQMYQDRIGKGSKILDSEKLYTQGNLKLTGVNYDMALSGDGFFTVVNTRSSGAAETLYTRAGNFRMGDNGTLQDAAGNEVQGWMMTAIDSQNDVTSTNPNVNVFNTDYTKLLGSKIIRHSTYVETITAKATDYTTTAKSDSSTVFSGDGGKTKSSKISDIEEAIKDYTSWLQKLKDEPDASSASSIAQVSQVNFKSGAD